MAISFGASVSNVTARGIHYPIYIGHFCTVLQIVRSIPTSGILSSHLMKLIIPPAPPLQQQLHLLLTRCRWRRLWKELCWHFFRQLLFFTPSWCSWIRSKACTYHVLNDRSRKNANASRSWVTCNLHHWRSKYQMILSQYWQESTSRQYSILSSSFFWSWLPVVGCSNGSAAPYVRSSMWINLILHHCHSRDYYRRNKSRQTTWLSCI